MALDWVTCRVKIGNSLADTFVTKGAHNPISWPELQVLEVIHGSEAGPACQDVQFCKTTDDNMVEEFGRLRRRYPEKYMNQLFPGRNPMQLTPYMRMPDEMRVEPEVRTVEKRSRGRPPKKSEPEAEMVTETAAE